MQIYILFLLVLASSLQLLMTASSLPVSAAGSNGDSPPANHSDATDCHCNGKNLTVNGNFLFNWNISIISNDLIMLTDYKETYGGCYNNYDIQLSYYPQSVQVTHDLLQKFYHGLILHRRFIMERMLDRELLKQIRIQRDIYHQLQTIANKLEYNIAHLYHLLNITGCDCIPSDCLQADEQLASLIQLTNHCFSPKNYPVNSVARRIRNDIGSLRNIIEKLEYNTLQQNYNDDDNIHQSSFNIDAKITSDNKWCYY